MRREHILRLKKGVGDFGHSVWLLSVLHFHLRHLGSDGEYLIFWQDQLATGSKDGKVRVFTATWRENSEILLGKSK